MVHANNTGHPTPRFLAIETATDVCSVVLAEGHEVIAGEHHKAPRLHSQKLTTYIARLFAQSGWRKRDLDFVAISSGPGSYTGLRIGLSTAKGICFGLDVPLVAVDALTSLACYMGEQLPGEVEKQAPFFLMPMLDARRMEVYTALFDQRGTMLRPVSAQILEAGYFPYQELMQANVPAYIAGDALPKLENWWTQHDFIHPLKGIESHARGLVQPALARWSAGLTEDLIRFEPFYLKDFVAQNPDKKMQRALGQS